MTSAAEIRRDREELRARWRAEGLHADVTLPQRLVESIPAHGAAELVFASDDHPGRISMAEAHDEALRVAAGLRHLGVGAGDVVAVQVPAWVEAAVAYQAVLHLGAVLLPIVHSYASAELEVILRSSRAKVLIIPDRWRSIDFRDRMKRLRRPDTLDHVVVLGTDLPSGSVPWTDLFMHGSHGRDPEPISADSVCLLVFTSGSTGRPKGVRHTHNSLLAEMEHLRVLRSGGRLGPHLTPYPMGHMAGLLGICQPLLHGAKTFCLDVWNPSTAAALVEAENVATMSGTPFFLGDLLDAAQQDGRDLSSIQSFVTGAAPVSEALVRRADAAGVVVVRSYGSSEHPTITCGDVQDPLDDRATRDGHLLPGTRLRILDDDGNDLGERADGEIVTIGPEQFLGYLDPDDDLAAMLPGGWFRTGDVGRMEDGQLVITGREKDIIIRGGENISAREVEDVLVSHDAVAEVAVVPVIDDRYGERVCAFVVLRPERSLTIEEIGEHFSDAGTSRHKVPERLELLDALPRTGLGKVDKQELRRRLEVPAAS